MLSWLLLALALVQFAKHALPPGEADLISLHILALDLARGDASLLYPGRNFMRNDEWVAHHERNVARIGSQSEPNWCFYPPLVPKLLVPLATLDAETWRLAWGGVQLVLLVVLAELIRGLLKQSRAHENPSRMLLYALVLGSLPVAESLKLGQTSLAVAVAVWSGIYLGLRRRPLWRAILIGGAVFLKPFLILVEVPELARRQVGMALGSLAVFAALMFISVISVGLAAHFEYGNFLATLSSSLTAYAGNQSLLGGFLRLATDMSVGDYGFFPDGGLAVVGKLLGLLVLGCAGYAQWRGRQVGTLPSAGLWLSAITLALPISWEHHLILLLPVLAYLWTRKWSLAGYLLLGAITVLLEFRWAPWYGETVGGRVAASLPLLGNLLLFVVLVVYHVRPRVLRIEAA